MLCWRLDRRLRSVLDAAQTLERLRHWGVGSRSYSEPWLDTTSLFGEVLFHITVAYAQLERQVLAERTRAGMDRARNQGKRVGRPPVTTRPGFAERWEQVRPDVEAGTVTHSAAARRLGVGHATLRLLQNGAEVTAP